MNLCARNQLRAHRRHQYKDPEQKFLNLFIHAGDICFDVGANLGSYSFFMSYLAGKNGAVYAFEPVHSTFQALQMFITAGKLKNVQVCNIGISDGTGKHRIFVPRIDGLPGHGRATLAKQATDLEGECEEVEVTTLDEFCVGANVQHIDFIKIDVEGAELLVLQGGAKTLSQHHPVLLLEVEQQHTRKFGYQPVDLIQQLREHDYDHMLYCNGTNLLEVAPRLLSARDADISRALTLELGHTINNFFFMTSGKWQRFLEHKIRVDANRRGIRPITEQQLKW